MSACNPAPPVGSNPEMHSTMGVLLLAKGAERMPRSSVENGGATQARAFASGAVVVCQGERNQNQRSLFLVTHSASLCNRAHRRIRVSANRVALTKDAAE